MSDLREALATWEVWQRQDIALNAMQAADLIRRLEPAARRFLALTETERRQWCVLHGAPVWNVASGECIGAHHVTPVVPCEIVPAHIIPADYLTEEGDIG